mmetsp:Transcript_14779/g.29138  ORF Transcript_14779/g.29138 Transcript_14779/m.29138 type:complete len:344 (-) Transcript_14779:58-1089(-)
MVAAPALPRAICFIEDEHKNFDPYDVGCHQHWECNEPDSMLPPAKGQQHPPDQVLLNVYELEAFDGINRLMAAPGLGGALHVGVEIFGREWSYGGGSGSGSGVVCEMPRQNRQHRYRETVLLERTFLSNVEVALLMGELVERWQQNDYHWLHWNCLAFANELCSRLGVSRIPAWIDRFSRGAGVLDMSMRGLVDGVKEGVQGLAAGACGVVQAFLDGPASCALCTSSALVVSRCVDPTEAGSAQRLRPHCGTGAGPEMAFPALPIESVASMATSRVEGDMELLQPQIVRLGSWFQPTEEAVSPLNPVSSVASSRPAEECNVAIFVVSKEADCCEADEYSVADG